MRHIQKHAEVVAQPCTALPEDGTALAGQDVLRHFPPAVNVTQQTLPRHLDVNERR